MRALEVSKVVSTQPYAIKIDLPDDSELDLYLIVKLYKKKGFTTRQLLNAMFAGIILDYRAGAMNSFSPVLGYLQTIETPEQFKTFQALSQSQQQELLKNYAAVHKVQKITGKKIGEEEAAGIDGFFRKIKNDYIDKLAEAVDKKLLGIEEARRQ